MYLRYPPSVRRVVCLTRLLVKTCGNVAGQRPIRLIQSKLKYMCQHCWIESGVVDCTPVKPGHSGPPTTKDDISPGDTEGIEQPPSQNTPPIKSDNSVAPNDDSNIIDEQQSNPNPPSTDQRAPAGNVGVLEELEDSSNSKSEDSVFSDNQGLFNVVPQNP